MGVGISGVPTSVTTSRHATLHVGFNRTGFGIPIAGWPEGVGFTHYKWRLDAGDWSPETPIEQPIQLSFLSDGPHKIEAVGKRDSGLWQDDPVLGEDAIISSTPTWTVQPGLIPEFYGLALADNEFEFTFTPVAGQSYTLEARESFDAEHPWMFIRTIPAQETPGPFSVTLPVASENRFFRLVADQ